MLISPSLIAVLTLALCKVWRFLQPFHQASHAAGDTKSRGLPMAKGCWALATDTDATHTAYALVFFRSVLALAVCALSLARALDRLLPCSSVITHIESHESVGAHMYSTGTIQYSRYSRGS